MQLFFWLRVPGDTMIVVGAVIFAVDAILKLRDQAPAAEVTPESERNAVAQRVLAEDDD